MRLAADVLSQTLTVSRRFAASPERLFDAWFDPKAVGAWLFATPDGVSRHVEIDARVGGGFAVHEQRGETLATHFGEYLEILRPRRIVFSFATERQGGSTVVTIDIEPDGAGSFLTLTHELDPEWTPRSAGIRAGWMGILEGLARTTGEAGNGHTLVLNRTFEAPRILVWKAWTEAEHMMRWLCPAGFTVLFAEVDLRIGGKWRSGMRSPDGNDYIAGGEYLEIDRPSRLVLTHIWERNDLEPRANTEIIVTLNERDGKTDMVFIQSGLGTRESAASHKWGWTGAFDNLARLASSLKES
ncbi:Activator of Hsp90 ATPase 1 family protein [Methylocella tundrae]|uniref:Activator of Hsp90 ATPase 1 family protein n=1 Tax=Methylocella tundrae TaxID=227605 RepID=A0A8B6MDA6_METTU|nr:SRPBCC family protein [Methylocella tundrae]VTZ52629.1 Activator of Hsp90 ATPase 1 family protein [Methylocella tundrae]